MAPEDQIVPFCGRSDLVLIPAAPGDGAWSVTVKDPLTLRYFRLGAEEHAVLELLDGRRTLADVALALRKRFPGGEISSANVGHFVTQLLKSGLLRATSTGFGRRVASWDAASLRRAKWGQLISLLSIRFRGVDPERFLVRIEPLTRVLTGRTALTVALALIVAATLAGLANLDRLFRELPSLGAIVSPANLPLLACCFVVIKVLHELGHAVACRRFGGECHEIGVILVAFMPLLYCDVTDSWMHSKRWPRIAVSLAGMLVELTLAAVCTFLWLATSRAGAGFESALFLNVMLICSVNTVLFNGNPLLRYDGYYVLSDLVGIPNLSAESRSVLWSVFDRWVLGVDDGVDHGRARRFWFLLCYGAASVVYRWVVMLAIIWFLHSTLKSFGLEVLSVVMAGPGIVLAIALPVVRLVKRSRQVTAEDGGRRPRVFGGLAAFAAVLLVAAVWPVPHHIHAPFVIQPGGDAGVFVATAGRIVDAVPPGTTVDAGDVLARLQNPEVALLVEQQELEVNRLTQRLKHVNAQRSRRPELAAQVRPTEEALASARSRLRELLDQQESLVIRSPTSGVVYPPPNRPRNAGLDGVNRSWSGSPLDAVNRGAFLEEQTLLCYVAKPAQVGAVLFVEQESAEFVQAGREIRFQPISDPGSGFAGRIERVALTRTTDVRREIVAAGLTAAPGPQGRLSYYQAEAALEGNRRSPLYAVGTARVRCGERSLAARIVRGLRRVFTTQL